MTNAASSNGPPGPERRVALEPLPLARPDVPDIDAIVADVRNILASGHLTNGPYVRELEHRAAGYLHVRHCVAVASCTSGLMLVLRAMGLVGDVIVPSFTFAATAHAVIWTGLRPVFADIDPETLTLAPAHVRRSVGIRASAILATHTYGTPCDIEGLQGVADELGLRLLFDAAHALGSQHQGIAVGGFGDAEVFSLSPTKLVVAGEGGLIATDDDLLAERCRIGRDYGNPGDYDCRFVGLNARMSEVHAAIALASLDRLEDNVRARNRLARRYHEGLRSLPGVSFPHVRDGDRSTYKDLTVLIDPDRFGVDARGLATRLAARGIDTRRYYAPPVHAMQAYRSLRPSPNSLPVTERAAQHVLTLPLWTAMTEGDVGRVVDEISAAHLVATRHDELPTA